MIDFIIQEEEHPKRERKMKAIKSQQQTHRSIRRERVGRLEKDPHACIQIVDIITVMCIHLDCSVPTEKEREGERKQEKDRLLPYTATCVVI
mmetsp:Transcript_48695/g.96103  ORF Transcript_48695/g.96103 Transcript_48695/m.96103 type:complete len:92 (-) Transcript_48695:1193-1468(-)